MNYKDLLLMLSKTNNECFSSVDGTYISFGELEKSKLMLEPI